MKASMANAAATLAALPTQMARLAGALQAKREAEPGAAGAEVTASAQDGAGEATAQTQTETRNDEAVADEAAWPDPTEEHHHGQAQH